MKVVVSVLQVLLSVHHLLDLVVDVYRSLAPARSAEVMREEAEVCLYVRGSISPPSCTENPEKETY